MSCAIKEARLAAGLTQRRMSELLEIPLRNIENWESEKNHPPLWAEKLIIEKLNSIKEKSKMTKYYFIKTNAENRVIATNGIKYYECPVDSQGIDVTSGVNLHDGDVISNLKTAYAKVDGLYNMNDIQTDYPNSIYDFNETDFDEMTEIAVVE